MIIYHGDKKLIQLPNNKSDFVFKDFGNGFYCISSKQIASAQALTKSKDNPVITTYNLDKNYKELNIKEFDCMDAEWLDFISACRKGIIHCYDIVIGPMIDNRYWDFFNDYFMGFLPKEVIINIIKDKEFNIQIALCTVNSLNYLNYI